MKKLDGCKTYSVILNERELELCKRQMLKVDERNIDLVSNTSKMLRHLIRLAIFAPDLFLNSDMKAICNDQLPIIRVIKDESRVK